METARPEQLPPEGDWRAWYVRGGRGSGKTRAGSETLAAWVRQNPGSEWAIIAPTFGDAKSVCVENQRSGILRALGSQIENWNRSEGVIYLADGGRVFLDGADDGALRIQGRNLSGAWCDEVGLWRDWDRAWNYSLQPAVRFRPARIVATGTPKLGHPLVAALLADPHVAHTLMRTSDNAANLDEGALRALLEAYGGTTLGRQELEGEFIAALEGEILRRADWGYYPRSWSFYAESFEGKPAYDRLPAFETVVCSWDTSGKGKETSDYVAGQAWGVDGPNRWLLRLFHQQVGFEAMVTAMAEMATWAATTFPAAQIRTLIEAATTGPDAVAELKRNVQGVTSVAVKGDKVQRAWAASPALESGHCFLPGAALADGSGYHPTLTPPVCQALIEEAALFRADGKHAYDDQVDAWSQMVNWTRKAPPRRYRGRTQVATG